jgi:hypothetical protein
MRKADSSKETITINRKNAIRREDKAERAVNPYIHGHVSLSTI